MAGYLPDLSIAELSGLIAARKLSPVEVVEALIGRVEQYDLGSSDQKVCLCQSCANIMCSQEIKGDR
jgi:Asp-tRNA(Asn)/Glu-tRNA(Gln) amidotransferase A subunit family amidase